MLLDFAFVFKVETLWQLALPAVALGVLLPAYYVLKNKKANASEDEDEDFFG